MHFWFRWIESAIRFDRDFCHPWVIHIQTRANHPQSEIVKRQPNRNHYYYEAVNPAPSDIPTMSKDQHAELISHICDIRRLIQISPLYAIESRSELAAPVIVRRAKSIIRNWYCVRYAYLATHIATNAYIANTVCTVYTFIYIFVHICMHHLHYIYIYICTYTHATNTPITYLYIYIYTCTHKFIQRHIDTYAYIYTLSVLTHSDNK